LQEDSTSVACADRERAHQLGVSSKGGAPFIEEGFVLAEEKGFREFQVLGFLCRCLGIILGGFLSLSVEDRFVLRVGRFPKRRAHHYLEGS
jgi:hypothetical protein